MPALCDANVMLALVIEHHMHHQPAFGWFNSQEDDSTCWCRVTQLATLRHLTNRTIMGEDVCSQKEAWGIWTDLVQDTRFVFVHEPEGLESVFRVYTQSNIPHAKLWTDAYLAAFSRSGELQMVTFDQDFRRFPSLDLLLLT